MTANSTGTPQAATDVENGSRLRMEKVREALDVLQRNFRVGFGDTVDAALAEVEEWEAARADYDHLRSEWDYGHARGDHLVYESEWQAFDAWQRRQS